MAASLSLSLSLAALAAGRIDDDFLAIRADAEALDPK